MDKSEVKSVAEEGSSDANKIIDITNVEQEEAETIENSDIDASSCKRKNRSSCNDEIFDLIACPPGQIKAKLDSNVNNGNDVSVVSKYLSPLSLSIHY